MVFFKTFVLKLVTVEIVTKTLRKDLTASDLWAVFHIDFFFKQVMQHLVDSIHNNALSAYIDWLDVDRNPSINSLD